MFLVTDTKNYSDTDLKNLGYKNGTEILVYRPQNKTTIKGGFKTDGCQLLWKSPNSVPFCSCTHLTDFAVIQIGNATGTGKLTGIRPRQDLYDLKILRHWYETLGFRFNLGLIPVSLLVLTFIWKEKKRLGFREALMKEFYVYLSKFKATEIKRLARQKELAIVGKNEQESKEDMLHDGELDEDSEDLTDDEDYKELLANEKETRASIEEKIKKYSADIQAMKQDLIRSRKQTNKVQEDIDLQMHLNDKEIEKLRERRVLLKGKEELKKLRIKQVELEKQRRLKSKLEALAKNKNRALLQPNLMMGKPIKQSLDDSEQDLYGKKIKQNQLPGFENEDNPDGKTQNEGKNDKENSKVSQLDASSLEIEKEIERDLKELEEEENRLKAELKLQEGLPDTEKELVFIVPKTAIKKKHPLVQENLVGYADVIDIFHKRYVHLELEEIMKTDTNKAVQLITEWAEVHMETFQNDKDFLNDRIGFIKMFLWCNPICNFFLMKWETFYCPKWYRALYCIWFTLSHFAINAPLYMAMMPNPIEKDDGGMFPMFIGPNYALKVGTVWSTSMLIVFVFNAVVGYLVYPSENLLYLSEDSEHIKEIL